MIDQSPVPNVHRTCLVVALELPGWNRWCEVSFLQLTAGSHTEGSTPPWLPYEPKHWIFIHNLILRQVNSKHTGEVRSEQVAHLWRPFCEEQSSLLGIIPACMKHGLCGTCALPTNRDTWIAIHYREDKLSYTATKHLCDQIQTSLHQEESRCWHRHGNVGRKGLCFKNTWEFRISCIAISRKKPLRLWV